MDVIESIGVKAKSKMDQGLESLNSNRTLEVLLSQEQFKQLQKLLPVGYSFEIANKNPRQNLKKAVSKDFALEDTNINKANLEKQKRKAYREAEQTIRGTGEFMRKCKAIVDLLKKHHLAEPFLRPVDPVALCIPDYFDIIKEPMDISLVNKRLLDDYYDSQEAFEADVRKIWSNAMTYNAPGTRIYQITEEMSEYFESLLADENPRFEASLINQQRSAAKFKTAPISDEISIPRIKNTSTFPKTMNYKPLSYAEKKSLSEMIRQLPSECLWDVWNIVAPNNKSQGSEELEFDIDTLPPKVGRELENFVKNKVMQLNKKKSTTKRMPSSQEFNLPATYSNTENSLPKKNFNTPNPNIATANNLESYGSLPLEPTKKTSSPEMKRAEPKDDDSSFISGLDDSDY